MRNPSPTRALIAKPLKPLRLELAQGCADRAVMGGLEGFLKLWAEEMTRLVLHSRGLHGLLWARLRECIGFQVSGFGFQARHRRKNRQMELV